MGVDVSESKLAAKTHIERMTMDDTGNTLEERLLLLGNNNESGNELVKIPEIRSSSTSGALNWETFFKEVKRVGFIAGPLMAVTLSQFLLQVISTMMVGHLGELALSSTSIAISFSAVTGFSLLVSLFLLTLINYKTYVPN